MSASVLGFIEHARRSGDQMPVALGASLLNAAARSAEKEGRPLRPDLVLVDELGRLSLAPADFAEGPPPSGYVAPEVRAGLCSPNDAKALVYAAGAFGWHLLVGTAPSDEKALLTEPLPGPLGQIVRMALAAERKERFSNLSELCHALESVVPRLSEANERRIMAVVAGFASAPPQPIQQRPFNLVMPPGPVAVSAPPPATDPIAAKIGALADAVLQLEAGMAATSSDVTDERSQRLEALANLARRLAALENAGRPKVDETRLRILEAGVQQVVEDQARLGELLARMPQGRGAGLSLLLFAAGLGGAMVGALAMWTLMPRPASEPAPVAASEARLDFGEPVRRIAPPPLPMDLVARGQKALDDGDPRGAEVAFRAALAGEPQLAAAAKGLSVALSAQKQDVAAKAAWKRYLELAPDAPDSDRLRSDAAK